MEWDRQAFRAFQESHAPMLRFFRFQKPTFTMGRLEARRIDLQKLPHPHEVRPTGGWTVLHGEGDLCYSLFASTRDPLVGGDLIASYQKISRLLQGAFKALGRQVELSTEPHRASGMTHCFSAPSKCELTLGGKKVSGGAQAREGNVFLQQGVILLSVSEGWRKAYGSGALEAMTGLNDGPQAPVEAGQIEAAVEKAFQQAGAEFEKSLTTLGSLGKLEAFPILSEAKP